MRGRERGLGFGRCGGLWWWRSGGVLEGDGGGGSEGFGVRRALHCIYLSI